ncbi:CopG family ribbon-helix-helix protein [Candidatus Thorarchaeota archaeon]|nr:MAG: CopG family ribbon-helix-helix protein [Candidatus Thorarchaeota archaeon]
MPVVAISMSDSDFEELENLQRDGGFSNRSEVVRHALQSLLDEHRTLENQSGDMTAIVTVVYSEKGKNPDCHRIQHEYNDLLKAMIHSHTSNGGCIEALIVSGDSEDVRGFVKALRSQRGISHIQTNPVGN